MKKKRKRDDDMPIGPLRVVPDFLPPPHELVFPGNPLARITILLDPETLDFFRTCTKRHSNKCHSMIREVLRRYAQQHGPKRAA